MPRFFRRLAEGVFDLDDLKNRTNELADFVAAAAQHYGFASDNLVAVGYSNGANIAAAMLLLRPEILPIAILFRAMVPLHPKTEPNLSSVRVWIGAEILRIQSFQHPRLSALSNFFVAREQEVTIRDFAKAATN